MSLSSSSSMICFNSECTGVKSERPRRGWRLRSGEYAELCDRCGFAFEEGRFCESFHLTAAGWRCCESCGKRVHCGCIVSAHGFVLLDAGGIECISCARKSMIQSTVWRPASMFLPVPLPERPKDLSVRNWSPIGGSGPIGPWQQPPNLFSASAPQSESLPRIPYDVEIPGGAERCMVGEKLSASLEKKKMDDSYERLMNGNLKLGASETPKNGNAGINYKEQPNYHSNNPQLPSFSKINSSNPHNVLAVPSISTNGTSGQINGSGTPSQKQPTSLPQGKQIQGILNNGVESSNDRQARNGKSRGRNHLLTRYWPKSTDQELQKIYGVSNSVITPLFEKMLSASDAGKIGRLVLPKKCAEAYLPRISQPEGLPLKVQDSKGQEWIFQFRFWPNNNSRMYVLEGITPCIQSMQLQAGDTVTFSRLEPEGKLVMGFRKASNSSSDQGNQIVETGNGGASTPLDITNLSSINQVKFLDPASTWSQIDKSGYIAQEVLESKPSLPRKRKNSTLGSKSKRLRIEHEEMIELKLTWEEAQGLLRPPFNHVPAVVVIEGFEFEEYEDAPILGRPTIFAADNVGVQWVQCDNCLKWRRIPHNALLPSKWCCSENLWDPERSNCSAAQELATEQLASMLPASNPDPSKKMAAAKRESDTFEAFEGLDALANLAILGEGENPSPSSQATTTKHPRHRPGCSCIVCIQPPSGKGPKHKQTCTCNVCSTVKRRFRTLMLNREKKLSEKEAEFARTKQEQDSPSEKVFDDDSTSTICNAGSSNLEPKNVGIEGFDDDPNQIKSSTSLFKGKIDLNIQPEREDEPSPTSDPSSVAA